MNAKAQEPPEKNSRNLATNRKAHRDYLVLEKIEAGIELQGTEVKSLRASRVSLDESFAKIENGEAILHDLHIMPYEHGNIHNHPPRRPRRLLLHHQELKRLYGKVAIKGNALVPLRIYLRKGWVKVELGLCKGKHTVDKRETLKRKTAQREADRAIAAHRRR